MNLPRSSMFALAFAGLAVPAATLHAQTGAVMANGPLVSLSVTEEVEAAPDMATVSTGVQTRAMTAREAVRLNAVNMDSLVKAILAAGIDRKDVQTSSINLNAQYDYNQRPDGQGPRFLGYEASNQLTVTIRKLDRAGDVIDQMVNAGATNINGPSFGIADPAPLLRQAREKAIRSASERAQFYATQTGYRTARLYAISETGDFRPPMPMPVMMRAMEAAAPATKLEPGQLSTSVTLNFQYVLER